MAASVSAESPTAPPSGVTVAEPHSATTETQETRKHRPSTLTLTESNLSNKTELLVPKSSRERMALSIISPGLPPLTSEMKTSVQISRSIFDQQKRLIAERQRGDSAGSETAPEGPGNAAAVSTTASVAPNSASGNSGNSGNSSAATDSSYASLTDATLVDKSSDDAPQRQSKTPTTATASATTTANEPPNNPIASFSTSRGGRGVPPPLTLSAAPQGPATRDFAEIKSAPAHKTRYAIHDTPFKPSRHGHPAGGPRRVPPMARWGYAPYGGPYGTPRGAFGPAVGPPSSAQRYPPVPRPAPSSAFRRGNCADIYGPPPGPAAPQSPVVADIFVDRSVRTAPLAMQTPLARKEMASHGPSAEAGGAAGGVGGGAAGDAETIVMTKRKFLAMCSEIWDRAVAGSER